MPRMIGLLMISGLALLAMAGCPKTTGDTTTVTEQPAPKVQNEQPANGTKTAKANGGDHTGTEPVGSQGSPVSGDEVVESLFSKRTAIQKEMDALRSAELPEGDKLAEYEQQLEDFKTELLALARENPEAVGLQLDQLALTDPQLAAELTALIEADAAGEPTGEETDGQVVAIALHGEPYSGEPKPLAELRDGLKEVWEVEFTTTFGNFTVEVYPELSPIDGVRFLELVDAGFYNKMHIHRIVPGWVIQWGEIRDFSVTGLRPGQEPPTLDRYKDREDLVVSLKDEPVRFFCEEWTVCFARRGPDTASTQPFINLGDNRQLETQAVPFNPFAYVIDGRENVEKLVQAFVPAMESAQDDARAALAQQGNVPDSQLDAMAQDERAWGQFIDSYWNAYTMAMITEAKITKRPDGI